MKQQELERENEQLRKEIGILVESPDSPEAVAIKMQWFFSREVEKGYDTGEIDIPKLLGLYCKMIKM